MKIETGTDQVVETDEFSVPTLQELLSQLHSEFGEVETTIARAKHKAIHGEYSDTEWFLGLQAKRRTLNVARTELIGEIARRRRQARQEENMQSDIPKHFVRVAKDVLSDQLFERIMAEAMIRYGNSHSGALANFVLEVGE